jgi:hypothetical protein
MLEHDEVSRQSASASRQRRETLTESHIQALNVGGVEHAVSLRGCPYCLDLGGRALDDPSLDTDDAKLLVSLDDLCDEELRPGVQSWAAARPCGHGIAECRADGAPDRKNKRHF